MNFVLGAGGRLGGAIAESLPQAEVTRVPRAAYAAWARTDASPLAARYLEPWAGTGSTIYVAAGIIDPRRPREEHDTVNLQLPRNLVAAATPLAIKVVTFGTVMENVAGAGSTNPYYASKVALGRFMAEPRDGPAAPLHVRIHTLFGGERRPDAFMFLGQMFDALVARSAFRMSSGRQLREYHHVDDEVVAIRALVAAGACGALDLSHGAPVALRDLARHVFDAFGCPELLEVGALRDPEHDNYAVTYERPSQLRGVAFRDALPAVVDYLRSCHRHESVG